MVDEEGIIMKDAGSKMLGSLRSLSKNILK